MLGFKKNNPKILKFYCDTCSAEVPRDAKDCSKCGSYFASVLCPSCAFSGDATLFKDGCPTCGYATSPPGNTAKPRDFPRKKKKVIAEKLPLWVFILTSAIFTAVLAAIFLRFQ